MSADLRKSNLWQAGKRRRSVSFNAFGATVCQLLQRILVTDAMNNNQPLYLRIYIQIVREIFNGSIKKGDKLPSKRTMCQSYGVSESTIRLVIKQLTSAGFIEVSERRRAVVVFDAADPETKRRLSAVYASRKNAVIDTLITFNLTIPPAIAYGVRYCSDSEIEELCKITEHVSLEQSNIQNFREHSAVFMTTLLKKAGNSIALSLYSSTSPFSIFPSVLPDGIDPFFPIRREIRNYFETLVLYIKRREYTKIAVHIPRIIELLRDDRHEFPRFLNPVSLIDDPEKHSAHNPYLYRHIFWDTAACIADGQYPEGSTLPTEPAMTQKYLVGKVTIRSACRLLNVWGLAKTVHGSGTQIVPTSAWSSPFECTIEAAKEKKEEFLSALHFLAITSVNIADHAGHDIALRMLQTAEQRLKGMELREYCRFSSPILLFLDFLFEQTNCISLKELYHIHLKERLLCLFYLDAVITKNYPNKPKEICRYCLNMLHTLELGDLETFANQAGQLFYNLYMDANTALQVFL